MQIFIKNHIGHIQPYTIRLEDDTVKDLANMINAHNGLFTHNTQILYNGQHLEFHKYLYEYGIENDSLLCTSSGLRGSGTAWNIIKHWYREISHLQNPIYGGSLLGIPLIYNLFGMYKFKCGTTPSTGD